jgi:diguanylate cyclase (GGDEF)-like protein
VLRILVPEGLVLAAVGALVGAGALPGVLAGIEPYYAHATFAAALLLAVRLRRGRIVLTLAALAALAAALPALVRAADMGDPIALPVLDGILLLLAVDVVWFAFAAEARLRTPAGTRRAAILAAQAALLAILAATGWPTIAAVLHAGFLPQQATAWTPISHLALLAFLAASGTLAVRLALRPDPTVRGLLWALAAAFLALHAAATGGPALLFAATAALLLGFTVVEASFALAYRDALTGLPTRRALSDALSGLRGVYTIAMVDVDHFKHVNDRHGHEVGDQVLRMAASHIARTGGGARAFRYGGEEFALLFPGTPLADAVPHLEALRTAIQEANFTLRAPDRPRRKPKEPKPAPKRRTRTTLAITVSVGAAEPTPRYNDPASVLRAADRALYRAKDGGRNQVVG